MAQLWLAEIANLSKMACSYLTHFSPPNLKNDAMPPASDQEDRIVGVRLYRLSQTPEVCVYQACISGRPLVIIIPLARNPVLARYARKYNSALVTTRPLWRYR